MLMCCLQAQNDTELSFDKNERLEILDRPPSDPDWYKARNTSGQIGLVPKNYLIELSQYLTQNRSNSGQTGPAGNGSNNASSSVAASNNSNNGHSNHADINHEDIKGQPWYFGTISRAECDVILSEKGIDGDFVIRESETNVRTPSSSESVILGFLLHGLPKMVPKGLGSDAVTISSS